MGDRDSRAVPDAVHEAAEDWVERMQRDPSAADREALKDWLSKADDHRLAYDAALALWDDGGMLGQRLDASSRALGKAPFFMRHTTQVGAAALGVGALIGVMALGVGHRGSPFAIASPALAETIRTAVGEIRTVPLAGGARVTLDTKTTVEVAIAGTEHRLTLLAGRVRVATTGAGARLAILAKGGKVLPGPASTIDIDARGTLAVASVIVGSADVPHGDRLDRGVISLHPGGQVTIGGDARPVAARKDDERWPTGMLALDRTRLGEAVDAINRYNRVQIVLADPAIAALTVSGGFGVHDPEGFVRAIALMFHLRIDRGGGRLIVHWPNRNDQGVAPLK